MAEVIHRLESLKDLPTLPGTVLKLVQMLNGADASASDIEKIVRSDEAIMAAVLRAANSAASGNRGQVFTLQESIARLGTRALQKIAFSRKCADLLVDAGAGYGLRRGDLWLGAVAGALCAEGLARRRSDIDPGLCYVAAMLRDVGKLAMGLLFGAEELQHIFQEDLHGRSHLDLERESCGLDHAELGAELVRLWGLPDRIVQAIRHHHAPSGDTSGQDVLQDIVHCADALASWIGEGLGLDGLAYPLCEEARRRIAFDRAIAESLMCDVRIQMEQMIADRGDLDQGGRP